MKVTIAITSCVYPAGLHRLLHDIYTATALEIDYDVVVVMDGNEGWKRLDQMERYKPVFDQYDKGAGCKDSERLERINADHPDYGFLAGAPARGRGPVTIVRHPENLGYSHGINTCLMAGWSSDFTVLLNDDVRVEEGWLETLLLGMEKYPNAVLGSYCTIMEGRLVAEGLTPNIDLFGPLSMMRGVYVRELIGSRGWAEDTRFSIFRCDIQRIHEPVGRGHDVLAVASPIRATHEWHQSLGAWQYLRAERDGETEIVYDVNWGARGKPDMVGRWHFVRIEQGKVEEIVR